MYIEFDHCTLNTTEKILLYADNSIPLNWKTFSVLKLLLDNIEEDVSREEFILEIWNDNFLVGDKALSTAIWNLRQHIKGSVLIQTIPRKGYRLVINQSISKVESLVDTQKVRWLQKPILVLFIISICMVVTYFAVKTFLPSFTYSKRPSLLLLQQITGKDIENTFDEFIKELEANVQNKMNYLLVNSSIKKKVLNENNIKLAAIEENIENLLYISIVNESNQQCNIEVKYEHLIKTQLQSRNWWVVCDDLTRLIPEILEILPQQPWK